MGIGVTIGGLLLLLLIALAMLALAVLFIRLLHRRHSSSRRLPVRPGSRDHAPQQPDAEGRSPRSSAGSSSPTNPAATHGSEDGGSRLHMTVDTRLAREAEPSARVLARRQPLAGLAHPHVGETV